MIFGKTVAILHYTYPPVIGGVEFIIKAHAEILTQNGCRVKVITGRGESKNKNIQIDLIPEMASDWPENKLVREELRRGIVSDRFQSLRRVIYSKVRSSLEEVDICLIHNVMTMHFNLGLTSALHEIIDELHQRIKFYLWCHDAALRDSDYHIENLDQYPWSLLQKFNQNASYIAISRYRRRELSTLLGVPEDLIKVIPNGIDIKSFLRISDSVWKIATRESFFDDDLVMLFPSRILKRKNYELAINITKELLSSGQKCKLLMTAPFDPHNPATIKYYHHLCNLVEKMQLENQILFLSGPRSKYGLKIGYRELQDLYRISDLLLFTSSKEGFGIPLLESGVMKLPIACTDIAPLREITEDRTLLFRLDDEPAHIAQQIIEFLKTQSTHLMFKQAVSTFSWEAIYRMYLKDLVNEDPA